MRRWKTEQLWIGIGLVMVNVALARPAAAHPMGNFSISHYTRLELSVEKLRVRYLLDFAEIPTVSDFDTNADSKVSAAERDTFLHTKTDALRDGLTLTINGQPAALKLVGKHLTPRPGAGGLDTLLLALDMEAPLPEAQPGAVYHIAYRDDNFAERTGWREIIAVAGKGIALSESSVPSVDQSRALTAYPTDLNAVPLQQREATFKGTRKEVSGARQIGIQDGPSVGLSEHLNPRARENPNTPNDAFTQSIAQKELTPGIVVLSLLLAFVFGAFHALSPGHGKAMVAAYLVGARGTAKHAVFLGAVVTLTHTIGVFALGLVTLVAAQYVVPEKLYPVLSALSGVAIVMIGASLFRQRLAALMRHRAHAFGLAHDHGHTHTHHDHHPRDHDHDQAHDHHHHDHGHAHDHSHHSHSHGHEHSHAHEHPLGWHDHGDGHYHSHDIPIDMPVNLKTLLVLGITGGALPCPSALVVMLSAIALHRILFGLALITAFSLGLAAVLTGIGLLIVYARGFLERLPVSGSLTYRLPVVSAAIVTVIGLVLVIRAVTGSF